MKKNRNLLFTLVAAMALLSSCEKIIHLDLGSSNSRLVIQGNVYNEVGSYEVKISKTIDFDAQNIYPAVTNATVIISDNTGQSETLSQVSDGTYVTSNLQGRIGRTYTLTVTVDGETYKASSTMPAPVGIDSIYYKKSIFGGDNLIALDFINRPNKENYYRVIHFVNNKQSTSFNVFSENTDQMERITCSFMSTDYTPTVTNPKLENGDKITVWLECIDKGVFEYFRTANSEGGQNASPANPVSNISNGALGYFSASSVTKKVITYQE